MDGLSSIGLCKTTETMTLRAKAIIIVIFAVLGITAQPVCNVRTFTLRDGLAAHIISSIGQTDNDLMWFSTWNGLCCFDGYNFQTFRSRPGDDVTLSTNRILNIRTDTQDNVWCTSYDHHLYLFDSHICRFRDIGKMISKLTGHEFESRAVFPLANGRTWIAGINSGENFVVTDSLIGEGKNPQRLKLKGFSNCNIKKVFLDQFGNEWLFTDKGAVTSSGSKSAPYECEYFAEIGKNVVIASPDGHVIIFKNNSRQGNQINPAGATRINDMKAIDGQRIALATNLGIIVINVFNGKTSTIPTAGSEPKEIHTDHDGNLWVFGSQPGIWRISHDLSETRCLHAISLNPSERTDGGRSTLFHESPDGTLWMIPQDESFCYYDKASGTLVPYALRSPIFPCLPFPNIDRFFIDRQGNLWFTDEHVLVLATFSRRDFTFIPVVNDEDARAVMNDHAGNIWIGMSSGEIAMESANGHVVSYLNQSGGLQPTPTKFSNKIYAIKEDSAHRIWIGTKGDGIYVRDNNGRLRHFLKSSESGALPSNEIYDFDISPDGQIWIATYGSGPCLVEEQGDEICFLSIGKGIDGYPKDDCLKVRRITHLKDGTMFLSTNSGLVVMHKKGNGASYNCFVSKHKQDDSRSLMTSDVMQTLVTNDGSVYVITLGGGIQKLLGKDILHDNLHFQQVAQLNKDEGMIQSAMDDGHGNIWVVRETSIDCYNPSRNKVTSYRDIQNSQMGFSEALPTMTPDGKRAVVAALGGAILFCPQQLTKSSFTPKIAFTEVKFQGEDRTHPILKTDELDVPSNQRNLTIYFAALDYRDNYAIRYAYKIEGKDKEWTYTSRGHSASFNHLPHGHLRLLVRSTNSDGVWVNNTTVLNIYSHPTFWETGWARLLYFVILCCLIALGIYIYTLRTKIKALVDRWAEHIRELRERRSQLAKPEVVDPDELFMNKMNGYLDKNLSTTEMKIDDIAEAVNMSRSAFQIKVKELTGLTPIDYVTKVRIDRACYLLRNSHENINQIAYSVGYSDPKYFSRVFKRTMGMTPSQFKSNHLDVLPVTESSQLNNSLSE